jgi:hypothetical protein
MMKAKVKATGEIVNVYFRSPLWYNGDTEETYFPKELEEDRITHGTQLYR